MSRHIHACVNHTGFLKAVGMATTVLFMALIGALKLDQVLDGVGVIENLNFTVN